MLLFIPYLSEDRKGPGLSPNYSPLLFLKNYLFTPLEFQIISELPLTPLEEYAVRIFGRKEEKLIV